MYTVIIELEDKINLVDQNKGSICLPDENKRIPDNYDCYIIGWGMTEFEGSTPKKLRHAKIRTVPIEVCNKPISFNNKINKRNSVSAGDVNGTISPCTFDSGGAMACKKDGKYLWFYN